MLRNRIIFFVLVLLISTFAYGYFFPTLKYFKCYGYGSQSDLISNKTSYEVNELITVKKYLYGYSYSIDTQLKKYSKSECDLLDAEVVCFDSKNNGHNWIAFNIVTSELSGGYTFKEIGESKYSGATCKQIRAAF